MHHYHYFKVGCGHKLSRQRQICIFETVQAKKVRFKLMHTGVRPQGHLRTLDEAYVAAPCKETTRRLIKLPLHSMKHRCVYSIVRETAYGVVSCVEQVPNCVRVAFVKSHLMPPVGGLRVIPKNETARIL